MSMDEFYKGAQMFLQGMGQLAQSNALDRAKSKLEEINTQQLDIAAKREAQQQLSQQLAFDFMKAQASEAKTQQAQQLFAPKQFSNADAVILEGTLSNNPKLVEMGKAADIATMQPQFQLAEMQQQAADKRLQATQEASFQRQERAIASQQERQKKTVLSDRQKEFNRLITKDKEAIASANQSLAMLNSKVSVMDEAIKTVLVRASGDVGNQTASERDQYAGGQDAAAKINRWLSIKTGGTIPESDRNQLKALVKLMKNKASQKIKDQLDQSSGQISNIVGGDAEENAKALIGNDKNLLDIYQNSATSAATKPNIKKYLTPVQ